MKNIFLLLSCFFFITSYSQFGEQQIITTNAVPNSIFAADIDGDGDIDVLSASSEDNNLAWYKNTDGQGTFGEQQIIDSNIISPRDAFAADLDGDGDKDIVLISRNIEYLRKLAWYENTDGLGAFGEEQIISIDEFEFDEINPADIDGDGDIDIVSSTYKKLIWFENLDNQGNFSPRIILEEDDGFKFIYNFPIDIDSDGDMDVVSGGYYDNIEWFENLDGLGNFGEEQLITIGSLDKLKDIHAADLDGDGDMDVLSASRNDGKIAWYENTNGQGVFGEQQLISSPDELYGFSVVAADIDNDGDMDVVSGRGDDYVSWYENLDGLGNFSEANIISTEADGVLQVLTTDINNDGHIDVISSSYFDDKIAWYENFGELGINENEINNITLYPNPTHNYINITTQNGVSINTIKIYDVLGRLVFTKNNPQNQLDISSLANGLLFVQLETEKGVLIKKIIKQ